MQTDTQKYNESITPNSRELEILKKYFPQCFSKPDTDENGAVIKEHFDTEKLAELLNKDEVDIKKEGFTLNFLGKSYARYQANLDSETVIVPDEQNVKTNSENVYIVGDNLDALQHLKYSYAEKIKCIYIDPPYNTGKDDFVYNDKFGFTAKDFVEKLDITEDEAERICSMNGKCTHSAWLTFMYPRLALARELLRDDGVIFISIDDNEQANLKRLCDEIFGEGNFVANFPWRKRTAKSDVPFGVSQDYEWILCYAKSGLFKASINGGNRKYYETPDFPGRPWRIHDMTKQTTASERPNSFFTMVNPKNGDKYLCDPNRTWRITKDTFQGYYDANEIIFPGDYDFLKISKPVARYFKDKDMAKDGDDFGKIAVSTKFPDTIGMSQDGTKEIKSLFETIPFSFPKNTKLLSYLLKISLKDTDIILDFFSGSATTAHAVMQLNAQDGGERKFIMVQLDEHVKKGSEAEKAGYKTIDEIGRERIRRAAEKIKAENPETKADLGFQTFYLKSMPQNTLDKIKTFNPNGLFTSDGDIVKMLGEDTLLQTWQLKDGFGFNCNRQKIDIAGCTAYLLEDEKIGKYLYLLTGMEEKSVKELIRKIESFELTADKIFVYGYSFDFDALNSLSTNLKTLKNRNPIEPIIRY